MSKLAPLQRSRPTVIMVSKALVVGEYQRKLETMAAQGNVNLVCVVPPSWNGDGDVVRLEPQHVRGYRLCVQPIRFNGRFHLFHFPALGRLFEALQPDLVHVDEEPYNLATFLALRHARAAGARTLFFTWQNLDRSYPPPFRWLERAAHRLADAAIAGTEDAAAVLRKKGYRGKLAVIPQFGVDAERFKPFPLPPPAGGPRGVVSAAPFVIGYLGRLVEVKGLHVLLEAVSRLKGEWRLELIGNGPFRSTLEARAVALGIADRVDFRERVPSAEVPDVLQQMDAVVLPSLTRPNWKEQFGRSLVEAMACGVAVVGSDSGEIPNVMGDAGLVVPEADPAALAEALGRLAGDAELRRDLGCRGRARVLERFTHERIAEQTLHLYREILNVA